MPFVKTAPPVAGALRRGRWAGLVMLLAGALVGCGSDDPAEDASEPVVQAQPAAPLEARRCPQVNLVSGLERMVAYRPGGSGPTDVVATGIIGYPDGGCEYDTVASDVTLQLVWPVRVERGPAMAADNVVSLPIFVAVVDRRRPPPNDIIRRWVLDEPVRMEDDAVVGTWEETLDIAIPLPQGVRDGEAYEVLIGFQVASSQP